MAALTIDELARETGLTVRNVRSHQARGLLPPPNLEGRTGYYGQEHVDRLKLIRQLQAEGLKLDGIKRLLADPDERLLALRRAGEEPAEPPLTITGHELAERLPGGDRDILNEATRLGILVKRDDGRYDVPSPALLAAAVEVVKRGVALDHALYSIERVQEHADAAAREFIQLFLDEIWVPFRMAGMPEDQWGELEEAVGHVRPLAAQALLALFKRAMDQQIAATLETLSADAS